MDSSFALHHGTAKPMQRRAQRAALNPISKNQHESVPLVVLIIINNIDASSNDASS